MSRIHERIRSRGQAWNEDGGCTPADLGNGTERAVSAWMRSDAHSKNRAQSRLTMSDHRGDGRDNPAMGIPKSEANRKGMFSD